MAYCRWSSDNWNCDLYCYEDVSGGFTIHIAGRRRIGEIPSDRWEDFMSGRIGAEEFAKLHREQLDVADNLPLIHIDLPHAGECFNEASLEEFKNRLLYLRGLGYNFPDHVLDQIDQEIRERDSNAAAADQDRGCS